MGLELRNFLQLYSATYRGFILAGEIWNFNQLRNGLYPRYKKSLTVSITFRTLKTTLFLKIYRKASGERIVTVAFGRDQPGISHN